MRITFKRMIALTLVFMTIVIFFGVIINYKQYEIKETVSTTNNITNLDTIKSELSINRVKELQNYYNNSDIKAAISIDGFEPFNYPVTQTTDNEYYLNHNYYKKYDSYGSIYADYRVDLNNSNKILIFGHSSSKKEVPFNHLENYEDKDFYEKHKYITLETETNINKYEIFSVYIETTDFTYMNMNFEDKGSWYAHLFGLKNKSLYQTDVELSMDDDILILQTCSKNSKYKNYSKKYLLIISRRVK